VELVVYFGNVSITKPTYIFPEPRNIGSSVSGIYSDDDSTATLRG
jgi:hypothetical protein